MLIVAIVQKAAIVLEFQGENSKPIKNGDDDFTKIRGGLHVDDVKHLLQRKEEAEDANMKNPPKVKTEKALTEINSNGADHGQHLTFPDHHGHKVAHNPETLSH